MQAVRPLAFHLSSARELIWKRAAGLSIPTGGRLLRERVLIACQRDSADGLPSRRSEKQPAVGQGFVHKLLFHLSDLRSSRKFCS